MYRLTQLALARKSVTLLLAAGVFVAGILAWGQLQAELLPDIDFPVATVIAVYPGAGTTDVAEQVSAPIERTLSSVQGVKSVRSTSSPSLAVVIAEFEYGTDIDAAVADIESNLTSAGLPPSVEPQVSTLNINAFPITSLTVQSDDASVDVGKLVRDEVVPELAGLPGVASVSVTGGDLQRVNVILDPVKLARHNVSVQQVAGHPPGERDLDPLGHHRRGRLDAAGHDQPPLHDHRTARRPAHHLRRPGGAARRRNRPAPGRPGRLASARHRRDPARRADAGHPRRPRLGRVRAGPGGRRLAHRRQALGRHLRGQDLGCQHGRRVEGRRGGDDPAR